MAVKVTALPHPTKWPGGSGKNGLAAEDVNGALLGKKAFRRTGDNRRIQDELRTLPAYIGRLEPKAGEELVKKLRKLGAEAELVEPDDEDDAPNEVAGEAEVELVRPGADETTADAQAPDMRGGEASEAEPSQDAAAPATPTPPDDPTDQIRKLGELRDAGLVTQDEFESKKAELLSRL